MTLEQAKQFIGSRVKYVPFKDCSEEQCEYGIITSVNDSFVFVRYGMELISKATSPTDLILW